MKKYLEFIKENIEEENTDNTLLKDLIDEVDDFMLEEYPGSFLLLF